MEDQASPEFLSEAEGILKRNAELQTAINAAAASIVAINNINSETKPDDAYPHIVKVVGHIEDQTEAIKRALVIHHMTVSKS